jgi:hypothetical protein
VVKRMNRSRGVEGAEAESLENRKDGILSFHRLNVPATLNVTFLSANHIENVMRNSRGMIGKVCRWNAKTDQLARWMGVVRHVRHIKGIDPDSWPKERRCMIARAMR